MAPTPITPNGQIDILYTESGFLHRAQMRVDIVSPGGSAPFDLVTSAGPAILWTAWVDIVVAKFKAIFSTSTTFTQAVLQHYTGGVYVQLDTYSLGIPGTSGSAAKLATQVTYTFKDTTNKTVKIALFEATYNAPNHIAYGFLDGASKAIVDSTLGLTAADIGNAFRGRGDNAMNRFVFQTISINKKLQRKRNLG